MWQEQLPHLASVSIPISSTREEERQTECKRERETETRDLLTSNPHGIMVHFCELALPLQS